jgi:glucosylceramidase
VMATPWSAPAWMKTNGTLTNTGSLIDPTAYPAFAQYFVKFVRAYEAAGIPIWAVSPVNEPLIQPVGYPSMSMQWYEQANFVRYHLGPAFAVAGIGARIFVFDHNWNDAAFPQQLLDDSAAVRGFVGGVAFHCYGGDPSMMDVVHDAHPDVDIYVTECSGGVWSGSFGDSLRTQFQRLYVGSLRHWAKSIIRWNLALDDAHGPYPPSGGRGCTDCIGLITVHDDGSFTREVDYWAMAHVSRFVVAGARRVDSNTFGDGDVEDVAFVDPDGGRVLVAFNSGASARRFAVADGGRGFTATLPAGAAATFTWY